MSLNQATLTNLKHNPVWYMWEFESPTGYKGNNAPQRKPNYNMITAFELLSLALGGNLENNAYEVIPAKRRSGFSFENLLSDLVCHDTDFEDICVCVGSIHSSGEIGYLVKKVKMIPTAHNLLGAVDAIYEVDGTGDEEGCRYYAVWVITN